MAKFITQEVTVQVADTTSMGAQVARPAKEGKFPGMLVLQEAFGVNAHTRDVAARIARQRQGSVAPELFRRTRPGFEGRYDDFPAAMTHLQALIEKGHRDDIRAAYDWLHGHAQVSADRIASIGFCMGGRAWFLACATVPLQASISYYGGGIAPGLLHRAVDPHAPILVFGADSIRTSRPKACARLKPR